jgi:hypothetical protein
MYDLMSNILHIERQVPDVVGQPNEPLSARPALAMSSSFTAMRVKGLLRVGQLSLWTQRASRQSF